MKKIVTIAAMILLSAFTQQVKEHRMQCYKGPNSIFFYIIKDKKTYHYNFTNHPLTDDEFKNLFWKQSSRIPIDTTELEKICDRNIREDQLHERIVRDLNN